MKKKLLSSQTKKKSITMNYLLDFESKTSGKYFHDGLISISGLISNFYSSKEDFKSL